MKRHIDFKILFLSFVIAICLMVGASVIFGFVTVISSILASSIKLVILWVLAVIALTVLIYSIFND